MLSTPKASKQGRLRLIASSDGREGSVTIHQDASLHASLLDGSDQVTHPLASGRNAYVHVVRGEVTVNGVALSTGDALKISGESAVTLADADATEILLFDLPA